MREDFLFEKIQERKDQQAFRQLRVSEGKIDFCSNDYLGIARALQVPGNYRHGSTGSRLLAGNSALAEEIEKELSLFHQSTAALIYNSGYDANIGLLSSVPRRGDTILYDYLSHASIRDGVRLSFATSHSFRHNDLENLEEKLSVATGNIFVVTESVFSMDGDCAPLQKICDLCAEYNAHLIVDEAHATGVIGVEGAGLVQELSLQGKCFARVHTFGKALGCHGAVVLGSALLRDYLINFSRSFIYTTALPESSLAAIGRAYEMMRGMQKERNFLNDLINQFQKTSIGYEVQKSTTPIQAVIIPGNEAVKKVAALLQENGLDVRPILYPTVPHNSERLRVVLHSFNTQEELKLLTDILR